MAKKNKKQKKNQSGTKSKVLRKGHSKKYYRGLGKDSSRNRQLFQERSGQGMQERIPQKSYLGRVREGT